MRALKVHDILAKTFAQKGVGMAFAILGDANMNVVTRPATQGHRRS